MTNGESAGWVERQRREELFHRLSHPFPMVVIDRVEELERGERIKGSKLITADEFYLTGHFPGEPIVPGVLTLEGMVQSAMILLAESHSRGRLHCSLDRVDRVKFKRAIVPGDRVEFLVRVTAKEEGFWKFKSQAQVGGETAAEADVILKVALQEVGFEL